MAKGTNNTNLTLVRFHAVAKTLELDVEQVSQSVSASGRRSEFKFNFMGPNGKIVPFETEGQTDLAFISRADFSKACAEAGISAKTFKSAFEGRLAAAVTRTPAADGKVIAAGRKGVNVTANA